MVCFPDACQSSCTGTGSLSAHRETTTMTTRVKGILFVDHVRMMRARKKTVWSECLLPEDLAYLSQQIDLDGWYPMDTYERMGLALLEEISANDLEHVRYWGRHTVEGLRDAYPDLFAETDIRETLMRYQTLRSSLFDYPAVEVRSIHDGQVRFVLNYGMSPRAEEAETHQFLGSLERTIEEAGARNVSVALSSRTWAGDPSTIVIARWS